MKLLREQWFRATTESCFLSSISKFDFLPLKQTTLYCICFDDINCLCVSRTAAESTAASSGINVKLNS